MKLADKGKDSFKEEHGLVGDGSLGVDLGSSNGIAFSGGVVCGATGPKHVLMGDNSLPSTLGMIHSLTVH